MQNITCLKLYVTIMIQEIFFPESFVRMQRRSLLRHLLMSVKTAYKMAEVSPSIKKKIFTIRAFSST